MRPNGELPSDHHADRRKAHLLSIVPPRAQRSRRCETQASLRRQAAKAPLAFRSLDPFRALREPDCRRRDEKRPFPLRTKNFSTTQNNSLDRKSPIQVCKPSVPRWGGVSAPCPKAHLYGGPPPPPAFSGFCRQQSGYKPQGPL